MSYRRQMRRRHDVHAGYPYDMSWGTDRFGTLPRRLNRYRQEEPLMEESEMEEHGVMTEEDDLGVSMSEQESDAESFVSHVLSDSSSTGLDPEAEEMLFADFPDEEAHFDAMQDLSTTFHQEALEEEEEDAPLERIRFPDHLFDNPEDSLVDWYAERQPPPAPTT